MRGPEQLELVLGAALTVSGKGLQATPTCQEGRGGAGAGGIAEGVVSAVRAGATSIRVAELLGVTLKREGDHFKGRCPLPDHQKEQSGRTPPFTVYGSERGGWKCFSCGDGGGDGIALYQAVRGTDFPETVRALGLSLGMSIEQLLCNGNGARPRATKPRPAAAPAATKRETKRKEPAAPLPWEASEEPPAALWHEQNGTPSDPWKIRDAAGRLFAVHCRFELDDGGKAFAWWRNGKWTLRGVKVAAAPLYGAELLGGWDQGAAVIVTEGEKAADALRARGLQAVATVCGSGTTPGAGALVVLGGWRGPVILWPDFDDSGRTHMERVRAALPPGPDVRAFAPSDLPVKGDAVEWLAARPGADPVELLGEILAAAERSPEAEPEDAGADSPAVVDGPRIDWQGFDDFCDTAEAAPDVLIGTSDSCFLAGDGLVLLYGKGGAGKTTLLVDLIAHAASRKAWLGLPINRSLKILVIENEGSRVQFRKKLKRKRDGWEGRPFSENVEIFAGPWAKMTLSHEGLRQQLAEKIDSFGADIVIMGPLARLGARGGGKPDDVTDFEELLGDLRGRANRAFAIILAHHENKGGSVSGAWDRAPETFLHLKREGGGCILHLEKVRDSPELHDQKWILTLVPPDGFQRSGLQPLRDYEGEIRAFLAALADGERRSQAAIARAIKAAVPNVREALKALRAAGAVDLLKGGQGVPSNTLGYRLAGPCLKSPDTGKHGEQGTLRGVSDVGACLPCPSPGRGHGERHARTCHPVARVSASANTKHRDGSEDDGEPGAVL